MGKLKKINVQKEGFICKDAMKFVGKKEKTRIRKFVLLAHEALNNVGIELLQVNVLEKDVYEVKIRFAKISSFIEVEEKDNSEEFDLLEDDEE